MKEIGRGSLFGIGFFFAPGLILPIVGLIALYFVIHWEMLIFFAACLAGGFVWGFIKMCRGDFDTPEQIKAKEVQRLLSMTLEEKHAAWHTKQWHTGCYLCDAKWPASARSYKLMAAESRRRLEDKQPREPHESELAWLTRVSSRAREAANLE